MNERGAKHPTLAGIPTDGESKAKRLTDFKGAQRDLLAFVWSLLPLSAMAGNSNCVTLGSCGPELL